MDSLEVLKPAISGCCVVCGTKTRVVCHRCGDFYCSKKCQLNDWQRHRYICFSIPALVHPLECSAFGIMEMPSQPGIQQVCDNVVTANKVDEQKANLGKRQNEAAPLTATTESGRKYDNAYKADVSVTARGSSSSNNIKNNNNNKSNNGLNNNTSKKTNIKINVAPPCIAMPLSGDIIYITGFRSVNRCFVREANENAEKEYSEICRKVNLLGKEMNKIDKPKILSYALAKYQDQFRRVKIIPGSCVRLQFLDLGFVKPRGSVEIHEISNEIMQLPCSIMELQLKGVPNAPMSHEVLKFISNFENRRFIVQYDNIRQIDLQHVNTGKSLNLQIIEYLSKLHLIGSAIPSEKKLVCAKSDAQNNLALESKMDDSTPDISVPEDPPKVEFELETQPTTKADQFLNNKEVNLTKEQISAANVEENNKIHNLQSLDKESSDQHENAKENIPSNFNIELNTIPPVTLETTKNGNSTSEIIKNLKTINKISTDIKTDEADIQKPSTPLLKLILILY
ncbi:uncharacterized protein Dmoj_GI26817, isoform B [Drosophila mojavensis]|uniref:Uncharacterized protein, isoform B n=1 Tax=Drosophila mojavensis TaxID=7230 RepID=A0A0Q9XC17_DROMO|nr:uncharacterized protein Dmoj_GI26817, isoform B [Drosophila mojavensis]